MDAQGKTLLIRTDGDARIGIGHVMRCLALAQAWQDVGGHAVFATATLVPTLKSRLHAEGIEVAPISAERGSAADAQETSGLARKLSSPWIVVDGYRFTGAHQRLLKEAGARLLCIDDQADAGHYYADIVLNQNIHAHETMYRKREPSTKLLLGSKYILLRREFLKWREWKRETPEIARKVLVTLGGSDRDGTTFTVIRALQHLCACDLEATIVVGYANPQFREIERAVSGSRVPVTLEINVTDMPDFMAWADMAVSAAGSTSWELAFMGLPALLVIQAGNQRQIAEQLHHAGAMINLGCGDQLSPVTLAHELDKLSRDAGARLRMICSGQHLVDGNARNRILPYLLGPYVRLQRVREEDMKLLWPWVNEPEARSASFSSRLISWEEHTHWLKEKLADPFCHFFIAVDEQGEPLGQIRFDVKDAEAVVSVGLVQRIRGKGYGTMIISLATQELLDSTGVTTIHAYIKPNNVTSIHPLQKAGYRSIGHTTMGGEPAIHLAYGDVPNN